MTMKITGIRTVTVHAGDRNWVLIRVETNEAGLYGAAYLPWLEKTSR